MKLTVYLSGEIHTDWRKEIEYVSRQKSLDIRYLSPVTDHDASDNVGVEILGEEEKDFWKDHKAAKINAMRIKKGIEVADIVIVKFGDKYRQWNAAFDVGYAVAKGKSVIVIHPADFTHALKEVDAQAMAVTHTTEQAIQILEYLTK
ncbi:YtoQ family protein [Rapidithrix thailandica]|uniref:YtoQ family protein n=1 Tax=Rapidithrix thailandica TaxID=413964 RepID=A0AAW9S837_9BACT